MSGQQHDLVHLLNNPVDLDDELADYETTVQGIRAIKHPLVFSVMHHPAFNFYLNQQLAAKRRLLAEAEAKGDWHSYVFLHERPYRADALAEIADRIDDPTYYWDLLSCVWIDSENIREMHDLWDVLLADPRPHRDEMMHDDELEALRELPDEFVVYQGHTNTRRDGWSWTTNVDTAEWFARRFANLEHDKPCVTTGTVRRSDVTAYFLRRGEYEVLVDPAHVTITDADRRLSINTNRKRKP